jgi:hypothetical protein
LYVALCFYTGYYGTSTWDQTYNVWIFQEWKFVHFLALALCFALSFAILDNLKNIWKKKDGKHFKEIFRWDYFIAHNAFYHINAGLFLLAVYLSPSNIMMTHPRRVMYAFSFNFIMVNHRM